MSNVKIKKSDEDKLVESILKKIKEGKGRQEKTETVMEFEKPAEKKRANDLKKLRIKREAIEKKKESPVKNAETLAKEFIDSMSEREEQSFNEMMEAVNEERERERIENLVCYIKRHKKKIPERLLLHLNYFPSLHKYFLLAEAEIKDRGRLRFMSKNKKSGFKLFPKKQKRIRIKINIAPKKNTRQIKKLEKQIARDFYIHIDDPSPEEKQAIKNLLEISKEFQGLYEQYKKLKFS